MKKIIFVIAVAAFCITGRSQTNQLKLNGPGIAIGHSESNGSCNIYMSNLSNIAHGAIMNNQPTNASGSYSISFSGLQKVGINKDVGVRAASYAATALNSYRSYGVYATAGDATTGWNYGVLTELMGSNNGTALFAASEQGTNEYIPGRYAGYFNGRVFMSERLGIGTTNPAYTLDVYGTIALSGTMIHSSDARLKANIADLGNSSRQIGKLRPVTYNFKSDDYAEQYNISKKSAVADTGKVVINNDDNLRKHFALEGKKSDGRKHIGFIAQEFREVFPELVYEDEKGMLGIDYVSLIPVLVETIQELNKRLEAVENRQNPGIAKGM